MDALSRSSRIGFIGAGRVGATLAVALRQKGYTVAAAASRTFASAKALAERAPGCTAYATAQEAVDASDVVFITTSDGAIESVASAVSWRSGQGAVHCSGAASLDILEPARRQGATVGALHPFAAFTAVGASLETLPGSTFAIEGDGEMQGFLKEIAHALRGRPIFLRPEDKPLYHATVVMTGGILIGYTAAVAELWRNFGVERSEALDAILPFMQGCVSAMRSLGIPGAVAGPYPRGDIGTVRKHVEALKSAAPEMLPAYCHMALAGIPFAVEKGDLSPERAQEITQLLESFADGGRINRGAETSPSQPGGKR